MKAEIRWKILVDISSAALTILPGFFNVHTGKSFIRTFGGQWNLSAGPRSLLPTKRFYDVLKPSHFGFSGPKLPLAFCAEDSGEASRLNIQFRLYAGRVMVLDVARSPFEVQGNVELLPAINLWSSARVSGIVSAIVGMLSSGKTGFLPAQQKAKSYPCMLLSLSASETLSNTTAVELLTRHERPSTMLVDAVMAKNSGLQIDCSTLLVDRQGVLASIPAECSPSVAVRRRFTAACNMLELMACVRRLRDRGLVEQLDESEFPELFKAFVSPNERFIHSTSSLKLWLALASEFGLTPETWRESVAADDSVPQTSRASSAHSARRASHAVILVHGIRTQAEWQQRVARALQSADMDVHPIRYGFFDVLRFLLPIAVLRRKAVHRVTRLIRDVASMTRYERVSIICHSFGTWILSEVLKEETDIRFHRVILCGGVIEDSFPWRSYRAQYGELDEPGFVVNDCGMRDILPVLALSSTWGYGSSGRFGFGDPRVKDRFHDIGHSGYFSTDFVEKYWLPFLTRGELVPGVLDRATTPWWVSILTILKLRNLIVVAVIAFSAFAFVKIAGRNTGAVVGLEQIKSDERKLNDPVARYEAARQPQGVIDSSRRETAANVLAQPNTPSQGRESSGYANSTSEKALPPEVYDPLLGQIADKSIFTRYFSSVPNDAQLQSLQLDIIFTCRPDRMNDMNGLMVGEDDRVMFSCRTGSGRLPAVTVRWLQHECNSPPTPSKEVLRLELGCVWDSKADRWLVIESPSVVR